MCFWVAATFSSDLLVLPKSRAQWRQFPSEQALLSVKCQLKQLARPPQKQRIRLVTSTATVVKDSVQLVKPINQSAYFVKSLGSLCGGGGCPLLPSPLLHWNCCRASGRLARDDSVALRKVSIGINSKRVDDASISGTA